LATLGDNTFECAVNDALCETLFATNKNLVDQLGHDRGSVNGIGDDGTPRSGTFTWHYFFSIFAP
jgi:hypothetical protein